MTDPNPLAARVHALIAQWTNASRADLLPEQDALPTYAMGLLDAFHQCGAELLEAMGMSSNSQETRLSSEQSGFDSPHSYHAPDVAAPEYEAMDAGIRETVRLLNRHGFVTTDSGDGVSKSVDDYASGAAIPCPNVACVVPPQQLQTEADRLAILLGKHWHIEATYFPADSHAMLLATEGDPAEQFTKQVAASKPTCAACEYLTPFELADDIFTCPSVNIRIHRESIHTFGCNLFEPKAALEAALAAALAPTGEKEAND